MGIQYWWWLVAIALGIAEMFTGSFYLVVLAGGAAGAGLAAAVGAEATGQFATGAVISLCGAALVRRLRPRGDGDLPSQSNPDVNMDIGQTVQVDQWPENRRSRIAYRGAMWDVDLMPGEPAVPGRFVIREIDGSRLRLAAAAPTSPENPAFASIPATERAPGLRPGPSSGAGASAGPDAGPPGPPGPGASPGAGSDAWRAHPDRTTE